MKSMKGIKLFDYTPNDFTHIFGYAVKILSTSYWKNINIVFTALLGLKDIRNVSKEKYKLIYPKSDGQKNMNLTQC